jgi:hypothetical protein
MLPTQKEAWGKLVSPEVKHSENATAYSLGPNRESVNDRLGIEFDFCSFRMAILSGRPEVPLLELGNIQR